MDKLIELAMEIQSLAQNGLAYTDNVYDIETTETKYFSLEDLPTNLAEEKTNKEQIEMCFKAYNDKNWQTQFD